MSGGSFNYICFKDDIEQLAANRSSIESMLEELERLGYHSAALETSMILDHFKECERLVRNLEEIWQAVEWYISCDWGKSQVEKAYKKYQEAVLDRARNKDKG